MEDISGVDIAVQDEDWNTKKNVFKKIQDIKDENSSLCFLPLILEWDLFILLGVPLMGDVREDQGVDDIQYFPTSALHESAEQNEQ